MMWKETNIGDITLTELVTESDIRQRLGYSRSTKPVPGNIAAIVAPLGSSVLAHPPDGAAYFIIGRYPAGNVAGESAHISIHIDGSYCRNVVFRRCRIIYQGGPLLLDNVAFEDCTFDFPTDENGKRFVSKVIGAANINFSASKRTEATDTLALTIKASPGVPVHSRRDR
jgi:hypothetical protein